MPFYEISSQETSQSLVLDTVQAYLADQQTEVFIGNDLTIADNLTVLGSLTASGAVDIGGSHNINADDIIESSTRRFLTTGTQDISGVKTFADQLNCDASVVIGNEYRNRAEVFGLHILSDQTVDETTYTGANLSLYMNTHEGSLTSSQGNDANQVDTGEATPASAQFGEYGIGSINFYANDNSTFRRGARILCQPTSVWSSGGIFRNPTVMKFLVNDTSDVDYTSESQAMLELNGFSRELTATGNLNLTGALRLGFGDGVVSTLEQTSANQLVLASQGTQAILFRQGTNNVMSISEGSGNVNITNALYVYKSSGTGLSVTANATVGGSMTISGNLSVLGTISSSNPNVLTNADDVDDTASTNRFLKKDANDKITIVRDGAVRLSVSASVTNIVGDLSVSGAVDSVMAAPLYLTLTYNGVPHNFPTEYYRTIIINVSDTDTKLVLPLYATHAIYQAYTGRVVTLVNVTNTDTVIQVANTTGTSATDSGFIGNISTGNNKLDLRAKRSVTLLFKPLIASRTDKNDVIILSFSNYEDPLGHAGVVVYT
jgi:hypothetical protein